MTSPPLLLQKVVILRNHLIVSKIASPLTTHVPLGRSCEDLSGLFRPRNVSVFEMVKRVWKRSRLGSGSDTSVFVLR